ncbi:hypothetical protein B566_EDAN006575 [Ephemera danica]|nr:hypothetical protein B566_EDAN006575 [Ephemera danica]
MNTFTLISVIFFSVFCGVLLCLIGLWFILRHYCKNESAVRTESQTTVPSVPQFHLPQVLLDMLETSETPKKETCVALNLLFHFLFHELRNSDEVRTWFLKKLSLEFDELLTRSTTGKLIDKITIRELDLGSRLPTITGLTVQDVLLHPVQRYIETLDLSVDLQYEGGFQLGTNAKLLLGATALVSVKGMYLYIFLHVTHLSGRARLRFTRQPYSHWSFTFYTEPSLELQVDSQFQGRPIPQVTSIIINQIRKAVKKKHTIPQFKLRYKPFFQPPSHIFSSLLDKSCFDTSATLPSTVLNISLIQCTRLHPDLLAGDVYCTLAVDEAPWFELIRSDSMAVMTVDLILKKKSSQPLGVTCKPEPDGHRVSIDHVEVSSPAYEAKLKKGDILLSVQGTKVNSVSHGSKLMRSSGNKFTLRVERRRSILQHSTDTAIEAEEKVTTQQSTIRRRHTIEQTQTSPSPHSETDSSGSSNTSPSNSPAKKLISSLHPMAETQSAAFTRKQSNIEDHLSGIQIYRTKEFPICSDVIFNESVTFHVGDNIRYFNIGVWSINTSSSSPEENCKDILLGHLSIPLSHVIEKCTVTGLGHFIKNWQLQEPCVSSKPHNLTGHSGFEPGLCYGDVLLSFVMIPDQSAVTTASANSSPRASPSLRGDIEPLSIDPIVSTSESPVKEILIPGSLPLNPEDSPVHDFVRTHFNRATQCDFCSKKV